MNDAYTIGITLALENGVSAGLAVIRSDLAAVDAASAATIAGLARLEVAATKLLGGVGGAIAQMPMPGAVAAAVLSPRATPPAPAPLPASPEGGAVAVPVMPVISLTTQPAAAPEPTQAAPILPTTAPVASPMPIIVTRQDSVPSAAPSSAGMQSAPIRSPEITLRTPGLPELVAIAQSVLPPAAAVLQQPASIILPPAQPMPSLPAFSAPTQSSQTYTANLVSPWAEPTTVERIVERSMSSHDGPTVPAATQPAAPLPSASSAAMPPSAPQTGGLPAAAPLGAAENPRGPMEGEVVLDGERVGRWFAGHLAREASRPPSGYSGFDPRMGMIWPGAPVVP